MFSNIKEEGKHLEKGKPFRFSTSSFSFKSEQFNFVQRKAPKSGDMLSLFGSRRNRPLPGGYVCEIQDMDEPRSVFGRRFPLDTCVEAAEVAIVGVPSDHPGAATISVNRGETKDTDIEHAKDYGKCTSETMISRSLSSWVYIGNEPAPLFPSEEDCKLLAELQPFNPENLTPLVLSEMETQARYMDPNDMAIGRTSISIAKLKRVEIPVKMAILPPGPSAVREKLTASFRHEVTMLLKYHKSCEKRETLTFIPNFIGGDLNHDPPFYVFDTRLLTPVDYLFEMIKTWGLPNADGSTPEAGFGVGIRLVHQVGIALKNLHDIGIYHRRLSLENIFIDMNGNIKLVDRGVGLCFALPANEALHDGDGSYVLPYDKRGDMNGFYFIAKHLLQASCRDYEKKHPEIVSLLNQCHESKARGDHIPEISSIVDKIELRYVGKGCKYKYHFANFPFPSSRFKSDSSEKMYHAAISLSSHDFGKAGVLFHVCLCNHGLGSDKAKWYAVAAVYQELGSLYGVVGLTKKQLFAYEKSHELRVKVVGGMDPLTKRTLLGLAKVHGELGNIDMMKEFAVRACNIQVQHFGVGSKPTIEAFRVLASAYEGETVEVRPKRDTLLHLLSMVETHHGLTHTDAKTIMLELGEAYCLYGQLEEAVKVLEQALSILEKHYGTNHPDLIPCLNRLSNTFGLLGHKERQVEVNGRVINMMMMNSGAGHDL